MNCQQAADYMNRSIADGISAEGELLLLWHVEVCPKCAEAHKEIQSIDAALKEIMAEPCVPPQLTDRIIKNIESLEQETSRDATEDKDKTCRFHRQSFKLITLAALLILAITVLVLYRAFYSPSSAITKRASRVKDKEQRPPPKEDYDKLLRAAIHKSPLVKRKGVYYIRARVNWCCAKSNELELRIDDQKTLLFSDAAFQKWHWVGEKDASTGEATKREFDKGVHTVEIIAKKNGVKVDKVLLTTDRKYVPFGAEGAPLPESPLK